MRDDGDIEEAHTKLLLYPLVLIMQLPLERVLYVNPGSTVYRCFGQPLRTFFPMLRLVAMLYHGVQPFPTNVQYAFLLIGTPFGFRALSELAAFASEVCGQIMFGGPSLSKCYRHYVMGLLWNVLGMGSRSLGSNRLAESHQMPEVPSCHMGLFKSALGVSHSCANHPQPTY